MSPHSLQRKNLIWKDGLLEETETLPTNHNAEVMWNIKKNHHRLFCPLGLQTHTDTHVYQYIAMPKLWVFPFFILKKIIAY